MPRGKRERGCKCGFAGIQPQDDNAAHMGIARGDRIAGGAIGGVGGKGFQLPPIGVNAQIIEPRNHLGAGGVIHREDFGRNDFQKHLEPVAAAGVEQAAHGVFLLGLHLGCIVRVIKA